VLPAHAAEISFVSGQQVSFGALVGAPLPEALLYNQNGFAFAKAL
jgi:hypothetical protein